jgi:3-hydroxyisobutyrate dehydrogenase
MKIGWIGLGVMGCSMAKHLQEAGHTLFLYNRTRGKEAGLISDGACWCDSPAAVAKESEISFTMVGGPSDVEEIYLGENGLLSGGKTACGIVVDMTTSQAALARRIAHSASLKGVESLDAPVSGGDIGAREATLAIMVGGKKEVFERVLPLFRIMGKNISHMGEAGAGQHTKICNQILVAGTMIGVCESLLYAYRLGLDPQAVIEVVEKGAAGSWSVSHLGPRIVRGDYHSGFFVKHFIKDMEIALQEAASVGLSLPGLALVHQLYVAVKAQGHENSATQALMLALKSLNGVKG